MTDLAPTVLLLGCGYTLTRVARLLPQGSCVVTTREENRCGHFAKEGIAAKRFSFDSNGDIEAILAAYPFITTIIDGIPPGTDFKEGRIPAVFTQYLKAIAQRNIRVIYLSTTGVSGIRNGSIVTETTEVSPQDKHSAARLLVEEEYQRAVDTIIFRVPAIYGPGRGIGHALQGKRYTIISDAPRWTNRIHVLDLASLIVRAIQYPQKKGLWYLSDDLPALQREVVQYYCDVFKLPVPPEMPASEARVKLHHTQLSNQRVSNEAVKRDLNYTFLYPSYLNGAETEWHAPDILDR